MAPRRDKPDPGLDLDRLVEAYAQNRTTYTDEMRWLVDVIAPRLDCEPDPDEAAAMLADFRQKLQARELAGAGRAVASKVRSRIEAAKRAAKREAKKRAEHQAILENTEKAWRKVWGRGIADAINAAGSNGKHAAFADFSAVALGTSNEAWLFTDLDRARSVTRELREADVQASGLYDTELQRIAGGLLVRKLGPEGRDLKIRAVDPDQAEVRKLAQRGRAKAAEQTKRDQERDQDERRRRREVAVYGVEVSE